MPAVIKSSPAVKKHPGAHKGVCEIPVAFRAQKQGIFAKDPFRPVFNITDLTAQLDLVGSLLIAEVIDFQARRAPAQDGLETQIAVSAATKFKVTAMAIHTGQRGIDLDIAGIPPLVIANR